MTVIAVAISGGVDSLVAAFLLKQQGHDIFGVHFRTGYEAHRSGSIASASKPPGHRAIERQLDIPIEILDMSETFRQTVVAYFTATYQAGRTPNPCLFCNPTIKFGHILSHVQQRGADALATGHYARVQTETDDRRHLYRGMDARKDQSYFLSRLSQDQLKNARFPLGELTKDEVRAIARRNHLTPTNRQESQDICFIRETPYHVFLQHQEGFQIKEGLIEDTQGTCDRPASRPASFYDRPTPRNRLPGRRTVLCGPAGSCPQSPDRRAAPGIGPAYLHGGRHQLDQSAGLFSGGRPRPDPLSSQGSPGPPDPNVTDDGRPPV
jgi:tRNA (5-methylaminomethyl-2-thiouridylate)-methyltransferase